VSDFLTTQFAAFFPECSVVHVHLDRNEDVTMGKIDSYDLPFPAEMLIPIFLREPEPIPHIGTTVFAIFPSGPDQVFTF
jgi:hypothetical protein